MIYLKILAVLSYCVIEGPCEYANEDLPDVDVDYDNFLPTNSTPDGTYRIVSPLSDGAKFTGDSVQFLCEIDVAESNVSDKISVKWYRDFDGLSTGKDTKITTKRNGRTRITSSLRIRALKPEDAGFYSCVFTRKGVRPIASRAYLNVSGTNPEASILASLNQVTEGVNRTDATNVDSDEPFCQNYAGESCQLYLGNRYVFVQPPHTQKSIEDNLRAAYLVISQSNDISLECSKFVLPSLCYSAFPLCDNTEKIHLYQQKLKTSRIYQSQNDSLKILRNQLSVYLRRICKDECVILETKSCKKEYAIAKRHPIISKVLDLEECEHLPNESEKFPSSCLKLGIDGRDVDGRNIDERESCYWAKGSEYRGVHDTTLNGNKCKRWAHQFQVPLPKHPELLGHSYCRNPGELENEPFCYVDQTKREPCGLSKCSNVLIVYIVVALGLVLLVTAILIWLYYFKRRSKMRNIQNINIPTADKNIYGNGGPSSPIELNTLLLPPGSSSRNPNKNCFQNIPNYTYKEVNFVEELGEGAFGKVYKGELRTKNGKSFVAVKSLKENASAKTQADFQREIELISELKHPNIICLLGIVVKQEPMCMLFEYMSEGDLHEFLMANSPANGKALTQVQFLYVAVQIAHGMEYLSDNHYVHRDLAARNCLVSKDLVVKISDFGLSRDMYSCDYYRVQSKSLLPVRWMPPESILYGKFTTESDVWSYGVVLWEIYSYGLQPYYGYNNQEVINMIRSRKLLPCPDSCPSYCYSLMVECWAELAIRRPSFGEIGHRLRIWKQTGSQTGAYLKTPDVVAVPQKPGHSSRPSLSLETPVVCPVFENRNDPSLTWERNLKKATAARLSESQSSLTSRSSNADQGARGNKRSVADPCGQKGPKSDGSLDRSGNPRNVIVSSTGENGIRSKLT